MANSDIEQLLKQILGTKLGKDMRQAIHDGIEQCYEDGKVGAVDLVARQRINNLSKLEPGSTTGDAELRDIRIGYDGTEYKTAGEAVRGQVGSLSEEKVGAYKIITSSSQLPSLADAEPNKIYSIGINPPDTLPDFPEEGEQSGLLVTLNRKSSINDGTIQIFGSSSRSRFYIRQAWGGEFGKWYQFNFDVGSITELKSELSSLNNNILLYISEWVDVGNIPDSPYNSADTFPVGSIVAGEYKNISNGAFSDYGQTITLGLKNDSYGYGAIQLAIDDKSNFYYRINWVRWREWIRLNQDLSEYVKKSELTDLYKKSDISMFESVGVIGDSYASGGMVIDGEIVVSYGISWPQILKRKTGVNFVNYSFAGATCKTWISNSSYGLEKLKSDDKRDLYCICMGINDADRQETEPTGTIDDIKDNYEENPDTFFGNMGKIISEIKLKSEKSKIILFTIPKKQSQYVEYSGYIKQIAEKFGLPCADSLTDQFLSSDDYQNNMSGGHPLAVGYSGMANSMENLIENSMLDSYFNDYTGNI